MCSSTSLSLENVFFYQFKFRKCIFYLFKFRKCVLLLVQVQKMCSSTCLSLENVFFYQFKFRICIFCLFKLRKCVLLLTQVEKMCSHSAHYARNCQINSALQKARSRKTFQLPKNTRLTCNQKYTYSHFTKLKKICKNCFQQKVKKQK